MVLIIGGLGGKCFTKGQVSFKTLVNIRQKKKNKKQAEALVQTQVNEVTIYEILGTYYYYNDEHYKPVPEAEVLG